MAMRKRGRSFSRRSQKAPVSWVVQNWDALQNAVAASTLTIYPLLTTGKSSLTTGGDTYVMQQRLTVQRIVGQIVIANTAAAAVASYFWGIILTDETNGVTLQIDPSLSGNADKSWLTLRNGLLGFGAVPTTTNQQEVPNGSHFDVRVRRVVRPDQNLYLAFLCNQTSTVAVRARTLVSRTA